MTADRFSGADAELRARAVAEARAWLGTPYRHQASAKGIGCDCLGLLRGVWRALHGVEPETAPPYTADWSETGGREALLAAAGRWLVPIPARAAAPGDVLVMRMRRRGPAKHCALLSAGDLGRGRIIHAYSGHGVRESPLVPAWADAVAGVFRLPASPPRPITED